MSQSDASTRNPARPPAAAAGTGEDKMVGKACSSCGKFNDALKRCSACNSVSYCGISCERDHRKAHKKECGRIKRALKRALIVDEALAVLEKLEYPVDSVDDLGLFDDPPPSSDCDICALMTPLKASHSTYLECCGKVICSACDLEHRRVSKQRNAAMKQTCPYCREPITLTNVALLKRLSNRVKKGDVAAVHSMGYICGEGEYGVPKDESKALKFYKAAAALGGCTALFTLAQIHWNGSMGLTPNKDLAWEYFEKAAKKGYADARYNLGSFEAERGNFHLAIKHFHIAAAAGHEPSMNSIKTYHKRGHICSDDVEMAEKAYAEACEKMKSDERDRYAAAEKASGKDYLREQDYQQIWGLGWV